MAILKRPPGDDFTLRLFFKLKSKIKTPASFVYVWSSTIDPTYYSSYWDGETEQWIVETELLTRSRLIESIKLDTVVIGVKDHLSSGDFNYWQDNIPAIAEYLQDLFEYYPQKKFILLTSVENLEFYIKNSNVRIVPWGGDLTNQQTEYQKLEPILDKNFDSDRIYLSLNRNQRTHRAMLVSLLYGLNLDQYGLISCMFQDKIDDLYSYTQWPELKIYQQGFDKFKLSKLPLTDDPEIYKNRNNDNVSNFKNKLAKYYQNTFVEIITETSYTEKCYNLTEKTLNSIYGCCFPILLCGQGSVAFLRNMGMDVFDDVINHSYDTIEDPADRLYAAITDNLAILTDPNIKEIWRVNKHRFTNNVDFAKKTLYNFYSIRAESLFSEAIHDFNI
jgi:hypothetical protein